MNSAPSILLPDFYDRSVVKVARALLGMRLVRRLPDGGVIVGEIVEAEAYDGEQDLACHARSGLTQRTQVMYGPPGRAYVYFTYGMHWMLNCVCGPQGYPSAVLLRAIRPLAGSEFIAARRLGVAAPHWCDGPGKLCRALEIDGSLNGAKLCSREAGLWIENGDPISDSAIQSGPRVGIQSTPEPWLSMPWRFRKV